MTIQLGSSSSGLISDPPPSSPHFYARCPSARTLPIYPGLRQAPNMLACIPSGLVPHHTVAHTHTTVLWPFFQDHPGELVPEENFWTLWYKGRLTEADTETIRLGATPSGLISAHLHHPPIFFYGPDALPVAQPTVSKH